MGPTAVCSYITTNPQKLQRIFWLNFPNYPSSLSSSHFTFSFSQTHNNWSRALVPPISTVSLRQAFTASFTNFCFQWDPNSTPPSIYMPEAAGLYFDIFCFFMFLHFLCCVYWDLGSLGYECLFTETLAHWRWTVEIGEGDSFGVMGSGLCFGRVCGLKGEGEMRKEKKNGEETFHG